MVTLVNEPFNARREQNSPPQTRAGREGCDIRGVRRWLVFVVSRKLINCWLLMGEPEADAKPDAEINLAALTQLYPIEKHELHY